MTTATEIITMAQYNFQGAAANTLITDTLWQSFFNQTQADLYRWLRDHKCWRHLERGGNITQGASTALTNGKATLASDYDFIISCTADTNDTELAEVPTSTIRIIDQNAYFQPYTNGVYAVDYAAQQIYVRPTTITTVYLDYTDPPADISTFSNAYTQMPSELFPVMALLIVSYAYASEEDLEQAGAYSTAAMAALQDLTNIEGMPPPQPQPSEG